MLFGCFLVFLGEGRITKKRKKGIKLFLPVQMKSWSCILGWDEINLLNLMLWQWLYWIPGDMVISPTLPMFVENYNQSGMLKAFG